MRLTQNIIRILAVLVLMSCLSCVKHRELVNFATLQEGELAGQSGFTADMVTIKSEDVLRITVSSFDPLAAAPFNIDGTSEGAGQSGGGGNNLAQLELFTGYYVDEEGYIDFPVLGRVFVEGKTLETVRKELSAQINPYLEDAVINVRYLNFKVTVLGEVNQPGTLRLTNRRVSLLDALGYAGDLTYYANRSNVLIIRERDGQTSSARLNLHDTDFLNSPYYYLEQNDVVYVEPLEVRTATVADPAQRLISYSSAVLSFIGIVLALTVR